MLCRPATDEHVSIGMCGRDAVHRADNVEIEPHSTVVDVVTEGATDMEHSLEPRERVHSARGASRQARPRVARPLVARDSVAP